MSRCRPILIGLLALSLPLIGKLSADVVTWDGDTSTDFEAGDNWTTGSTPTSSITADTAAFGVVGTSTQPALTANRSLLGVNFTGAGWTLSGPHTLTLGAGGIGSAGSGTNSLTASGLLLGADSTWTVGSGNRLSVSSHINGSGKLTKSGTGELIVAGTNTHTGATTIAAGTLTLGADSALSPNSRLTLGNGGALKLNGHNATLYGVNGDTTVANSTIINGASTPVTLTLSCDSGNFSYYKGTIGKFGGSDEENAIAIVVPSIGSGLTVRWMRAPNYYTGGTTVNGNSMASEAQGALGTGPVTINTGGRLVAIGAGSLKSSATGNPSLQVTLNSGATLDFRSTGASGSTQTIGGNITIAGNATFQSSGTCEVLSGSLTIGPHTLTQTGTPKLIFGDTTLTGTPTFNISTSSGTLQLGAVSGAYGLIKDGDGTLELAAQSTYSGETTIKKGTLALAANDALSASSKLTINADATLKLNGHSATAHNLAGTGGKIINGGPAPVTLFVTPGTGEYGRTYNGTIGQSGGTAEDNAIALVFSGTGGAIWLDRTNYYTGGTTVNGQVLVARAQGALGTGPVTINSGGRLLANSEGALEALDNTSLNVTLNGGILDFRGLSSGAEMNVGGNISVVENSTLQMSAIDPNVSNAQIVTGGPLSIGASTLTVQTGANINKVPEYILTFGTTTLTGDATFVVKNFNNETGIGTLRLNNVGGNYGFTRSGDGTLTLSGTSTYSGATTVSRGTLMINGSKTGSGSINVASGATLVGSVDVAGAVTIGEGGFLTGSGAFSDLVTVNGTHAPGNSPDIQVFQNGLTYGANSTLVWDLIANSEENPGVNYDLIRVTGGDLVISDGATLSLVFGGDVDFANPFWNTAHTWTLIDYSGIGTSTGSFTNLLANALDEEQGGFVVSNVTGDLQLTWNPTATMVPEPSTAILTALAGIIGVVWGVRRKSEV